jgi:hypothetical protein
VRHPIILSLVAGSLALSSATVSARRADEAAIRQTVQYYFDGGRNGDSVALRKAFHPEARMLFVRDGGLAVVPIGEYISRVAENKPKAGAVDSTERRVAAIDIAGDAAIAKLELKRPNALITDYMSLLKVDGHWVIVNKSYSRAPAPTQASN